MLQSVLYVVLEIFDRAIFDKFREISIDRLMHGAPGWHRTVRSAVFRINSRFNFRNFYHALVVSSLSLSWTRVTWGGGCGGGAPSAFDPSDLWGKGIQLCEGETRVCVGVGVADAGEAVTARHVRRGGRTPANQPRSPTNPRYDVNCSCSCTDEQISVEQLAAFHCGICSGRNRDFLLPSDRYVQSA